MGRTYCDEERRPFDDSEFARTAGGVTVHVLTTTHGHTTEGWPAAFSASRAPNGGWQVSSVTIRRPVLDVAADIAPDDV